MTDVSLKYVSELAERQVAAEAEVADKKAALKESEEKCKYISEVLLPNAMEEAGLSSFTLENGAAVSVKREYTASISAENWPDAENWLRERNLDGIIKHNVELSFGKGEDASAIRAVDALVEMGYAPIDKKAIHPMTLKAFVKEQLQQGVDVPQKTFGLFEIVKTKIVQPK